MKNSLVPINRIPPEVFSLIPDCYENRTDRHLLALTHVCQRWRDIFTSRASLWTQLDFANADKTRTYIRRSQSYPLKFRFGYDEVLRDAFTPVIPHIHRLECLTISAYALPSILTHFHCHAPLLEKLDIRIFSHEDPVLDDALFNSNLSRLRDLHLRGVFSRLSWKNLANLQVVDLYSSCRGYRTTQLLDFFESAPLPHTVSLMCSTADSSDRKSVV